MVIGFIGLLFNIFFNWIFVYGKFGVLELGGVGCGVVIVIVYWIMLLLLLFYIVIFKCLVYVKVFEIFYKL